MEALCGDFHLLERSVQDHLNRTIPDISLCFQLTVLTWVPTAYMLLGFIPYLFALKKRVKFYIVRTWINVLKTVFSVFMILGALSELTLRISDHVKGRHIWTHQLLAPGFIFLASVVSLIVAEFERRKSVRTSVFLAGFWILCTTTYVIRFRSAIIRSWYQILLGDFIVICLCCFFCIINMILNFMVDKKPVFYAAKEQQGKPCPSSSASVLSRLFFFWPARTIWKGFKRPLELEDMWDLQRIYTCQYNHNLLNRNWQDEIKKAKRRSMLTVEIQSDYQLPLKDQSNKMSTVNIEPTAQYDDHPSLFRAILKTFWTHFIWVVALQLIHTLIIITIPQILRKLIQFSEDHSLPVYNGVVYAFLLLIASLVKCLLYHHMIIIQDKQGQCVSAAMMAMVYKKSLKLTPAARKDTTTGEIVNLMSSDCNGYFELMTFFRALFNFPLHIALTMMLLWNLLGASSMVGLGVILLIIPINAIIARIRKKIEIKRRKLKDRRMKETSEVLNGIKTIKLHAWESSFERKINNLRKEEVKLLKYSTYLMSLSDCIHSFLPFLVALCTFVVYVMSSDDHVLTAEKAFVSLAYFQVLQQPLIMLSRVVKNLVHTTVAHKRLHAFICKEELDAGSVLRTGLNDYSVIIRHGSFSWNKQEEPILKNIELLVPRSSITAVVGAVGAGKSSLLSACLGEMVINSGIVNVKGSIALVGQQTWLRQASICENVLFGKEYDQIIYDAVVRECALLPDLEEFPSGDATLLGEEGVSLSGGQKMRISLARAVYQDKDVYLLDDPLSALDANVARHIFDRVIGSEGMLKNKTRVLVTQALWLLPQVDQIIVLQNGEICETGTYSSLMANRSVFFQLYTTFRNQDQIGTSCAKTLKVTQSFQGNNTIQTRPSVSSSNSSGEELAAVSLPEGLNTKATEDSAEEGSSRPRSLMFVRSVLETDVSTGNNTQNNSSQSWRRRKQQLRKRLRAIQNKLGRVYKDDQQYTSHYFVSEADLKREDEIMLPEEPASEHVDLEQQQDQLLCEASSDEELKADVDKHAEQNKKKVLLIREEELEKGRVKMIVYATYLRAIGLVPCLCALILCFISRGLDIASSVWLVRWSDQMSVEQQEQYDASVQSYGSNSTVTDWNVSHPNESIASASHSKGYFVSGYAILGAIGILVSTVWISVSTAICLKASVQHHANLVHNVMLGPMSFFDSTPLGRILNRFSGDVMTMDLRLPVEFRNLMKFMVGALGSIVVVTIVTPWSLVAWLVLGALYSFVQVVFVPNLRQVRRLISTNNSPIYSHFTETLQGVSSIRAFSMESNFTEMFYSRVNRLLKTLYVGYHFNRFLSVVIEGIGASSVFLAALFAVLARSRLSAGLLALSVTYVSQITYYLNWLVRLTSACESDIVSVERIKEYIDISPEGALTVPTKTVDKDWPSRGDIELKDYSTSYRPGSDPVLKRISCHIYSGEKIGLVGRTGAGKTTLTMALFRMIEASQGAIYIDGVNIAEIPLQQLRKRLTIIPQDPVLFSGTLRFNLDPFCVHSEDNLWTVLRLSHLADRVQELPGKLNFICSEGGHNLSVGQRQLVCLARALLRHSKILILDEATASCDAETDEVIQRTIRSEFSACTVITVAHRLNTVKDYDRIMVLDHGILKEMDTPKKLMDDPTTIFHTMAKNAGLIPSAFHRI